MSKPLPEFELGRHFMTFEAAQGAMQVAAQDLDAKLKQMDEQGAAARAAFTLAEKEYLKARATFAAQLEAASK